ncbi:hypothetical protein P9112_012303 [Eukaryota sp. TZLM1-RC]
MQFSFDQEDAKARTEAAEAFCKFLKSSKNAHQIIHNLPDFIQSISALLYDTNVRIRLHGLKAISYITKLITLDIMPQLPSILKLLWDSMSDVKRVIRDTSSKCVMIVVEVLSARPVLSSLLDYASMAEPATMKRGLQSCFFCIIRATLTNATGIDAQHLIKKLCVECLPLTYNDSKLTFVFVETLIVLGDSLGEDNFINTIRSFNTVSDELYSIIDTRLGFPERPSLSSEEFVILPEDHQRKIKSSTPIPPPSTTPSSKPNPIVSQSMRQKLRRQTPIPASLPPTSMSNYSRTSPVPPLSIESDPQTKDTSNLSNSLTILKKLRGTVSAKTTPQHNKVRRKAMSAGLLRSTEDRKSLLYSITWPQSSSPVSAPVSPIAGQVKRNLLTRGSLYATYNPSASPSLDINTAVNDLNSDNWETCNKAIESITKHSKEPNPDITVLKTCLPLLINQANNLRSSVSKNALIALSNVCSVLGRHLDSELPSLLSVLFRKISEPNLFLSETASETLFVTIKVVSSTKALSQLQSYFGNLNALVRAEAVNALGYMVEFNSSTLNTSLYEKIISIIGNFLGDASPIVRGNARKVLLFLNNNGFSSIISKLTENQHFPPDISSKISKLIFSEQNGNKLHLSGSNNNFSRKR